MGGDPWSDHQCSCERCTTLRQTSRDANWIDMYSTEPEHVKRAARATKHAVGGLVEALHREHVPQCYTLEFEEEEKFGLGYNDMGDIDNSGYDYHYEYESEGEEVGDEGVEGEGYEVERALRDLEVDDDAVRSVFDQDIKDHEEGVKHHDTDPGVAEKLATCSDLGALHAEEHNNDHWASPLTTTLLQCSTDPEGNKLDERHKLRAGHGGARW
ncbi:hypothetical protein LTR56_021576 [Elasticomyces elasticus]|nr:hypothetical protein LTR56_021576 [Elasticomyces elasticus]KAK3626026.1 hypothetical protein LTR22_023334 [Elasticomyces elasticus]KAK4926744.1 hypothetical protein LTR49_006426 [Elasticomyces elasticus]KAK5762305.1 hypothetical protein LTS12_007464 [Elasticomyces elasticus]